jgi:hypothetical protein
MATTFVAGKTVGVDWTPSGASSVTLNVEEHTWTESVDPIDCTHTGSSGVQCLIAGVGRGEGTVKAKLDVDTGKPFFNSTNLIRAGQKGVLIHKTSTSPASSYNIPCLITRVMSATPVNGAVNYEFTVQLDALAGSYTYTA